MLLLLVPRDAVARCAGDEARTLPGQLIVGWRTAPGAPSQRVAPFRAGSAAIRAAGIAPRAATRWLAPRTQLLHVDPANGPMALAALRRRPEIAFAEPNHLRCALGTPAVLVDQPRVAAHPPDDPLYPLQWYARAIRAEVAWSMATGDAGVVVAVVDTGVLAEHPALAGRLLPGYDFISDGAAAGDGDGRDADPADAGAAEVPHGTHVAGIIAARADDGAGTAGLDWAAQILPVRVLGVDGAGNDADIADGIRWAAGIAVPGAPPNPHPAKVINLSFGSPGYGRALHEAIGDAMQAGAIVVAAAGNGGRDARDTYPAAVSGVLTVAAADARGVLAPYSNFGNVVDLLAPGGDLTQTLRYDGVDWPAGILSLGHPGEGPVAGYAMAEGTSQAAPIVSAVVSLLASVDPELDQLRAAELLMQHADRSQPCRELCGAGFLDAAASLAAATGRQRAAQSTAPEQISIEGVVGCSVARGIDATSDGAIVFLLVGMAWMRARRRKRGRPSAVVVLGRRPSRGRRCSGALPELAGNAAVTPPPTLASGLHRLRAHRRPGG